MLLGNTCTRVIWESWLIVYHIGCPPSPRPNSPLVIEEWRALLNHHPDGELKNFFLLGMVGGFHTGFNYSQYHKSAKRNILSTMQNPSLHLKIDHWAEELVHWDQMCWMLWMYMLIVLVLFLSLVNHGGRRWFWTYPIWKVAVLMIGLSQSCAP